MNKTNPKSLASYAKPKVDWTKVPAGTMIHARDYEDGEWIAREFISDDHIHYHPFTCKSVNYHGETTDYQSSWEFAELIQDQPEQTAPVTDVKFEGDNVLVPVTTYLEITASEYHLIQKLYPNNKVSIIKFIREVHKFGLVETKKICDTICGLN